MKGERNGAHLVIARRVGPACAASAGHLKCTVFSTDESQARLSDEKAIKKQRRRWQPSRAVGLTTNPTCSVDR
jgi:hypothetical protein